MLELFVQKWGSAHYPPVAISEDDLRAAEERLQVRLPNDYRNAMLEVGLPQPTIDLMDAIVDHKLQMPSIGDFFSPSEMVEETLAWRQLGMPNQLIAFASDGCGNKFCFDEDQLRADSASSAAVWFFDHDLGTIERLTPSFTDWIAAYSEIEV